VLEVEGQVAQAQEETPAETQPELAQQQEEEMAVRGGLLLVMETPESRQAAAVADMLPIRLIAAVGKAQRAV